MKNYESPGEALSDLKTRGYVANFTVETETASLYAGELDVRLDPEEFHVDEVYRFDCNAIRDNNAIVYAISDPASGVKGTLVNSLEADFCSLSFFPSRLNSRP